MHNVVWGCAEILPVTVLISPLKKKIGEAFKHNFLPHGEGNLNGQIIKSSYHWGEGLPLGVRDVEVFNACHTSPA